MTYNSPAASKALWAKRLALTAALPALVGTIGWLVGGESSPFRSYFLYHVDWPNRLMSLNLPAFVIAALLSHNVHAPAEWAMWVGFLLQWLPLGFLLSLACVRRSRRGRQRHSRARAWYRYCGARGSSTAPPNNALQRTRFARR